jgi:hypothetical protein
MSFASTYGHSREEPDHCTVCTHTHTCLRQLRREVNFILEGQNAERVTKLFERRTDLKVRRRWPQHAVSQHGRGVH